MMKFYGKLILPFALILAGCAPLESEVKPAAPAPVVKLRPFSDKIKGTDRVIPVGKTIPRPGTRVELRFGAPMDLSDEYAIVNTKEASQKIIDRVMTAIGELQNGRIPETLEKKGVPGE